MGVGDEECRVRGFVWGGSYLMRKAFSSILYIRSFGEVFFFFFLKTLIIG